MEALLHITACGRWVKFFPITSSPHFSMKPDKSGTFIAQNDQTGSLNVNVRCYKLTILPLLKWMQPALLFLRAFIEDCAAGRCCINYCQQRPLLQSAPLQRQFLACIMLMSSPLSQSRGCWRCFPACIIQRGSRGVRRRSSFSLCVLCPGCELCGRQESRSSILPSIMRYFSTFLLLDLFSLYIR